MFDEKQKNFENRAVLLVLDKKFYLAVFLFFAVVPPALELLFGIGLHDIIIEIVFLHGIFLMMIYALGYCITEKFIQKYYPDEYDMIYGNRILPHISLNLDLSYIYGKMENVVIEYEKYEERLADVCRSKLSSNGMFVLQLTVGSVVLLFWYTLF